MPRSPNGPPMSILKPGFPSVCGLHMRITDGTCTYKELRLNLVVHSSPIKSGIIICEGEEQKFKFTSLRMMDGPCTQMVFKRDRPKGCPRQARQVHVLLQ